MIKNNKLSIIFYLLIGICIIFILCNCVKPQLIEGLTSRKNSSNLKSTDHKKSTDLKIKQPQFNFNEIQENIRALPLRNTVFGASHNILTNSNNIYLQDPSMGNFMINSISKWIGLKDASGVNLDVIKKLTAYINHEIKLLNLLGIKNIAEQSIDKSTNDGFIDLYNKRLDYYNSILKHLKSLDPQFSFGNINMDWQNDITNWNRQWNADIANDKQNISKWTDNIF